MKVDVVRIAGLDLGGSKIAGVLVDGTETPARIWREHTARGTGPVLDLVASAVTELSGGAPVERIGLSVAGWLDPGRRVVHRGLNLGLADAPLADELQEALGIPVTLFNDGDATAYGEYTRGAGGAARVCVVLALGTGVAGGVLIDGRPLTGAGGLAGELGHLPIDPDGALCSCGGRGCLETLASGPAVAARAVELIDQGRGAGILARSDRGRPVDSRQVALAAADGDDEAIGLLAAAGRAVGRAVALLVPVIDPDLVVVTGSLAIGAGEIPLAAARAACAIDLPLSTVRRPPPIVAGAAGGYAAAFGAADLARDRSPSGRTPP